ncbi:unnamed protein product [Vicia faba]|uniref:Uncharacterized protein n=1 Tax=Vicia faba TaxID=3906 RepID=A0AAV0ZXJ3_VICFA|nr:unnamed protein product [Vicia faba]
MLIFLRWGQKNWQIEVNGTPMYRLLRKLKRLQPCLRALNRKVTNEVKKIHEYRDQVTQAQQKLNRDLFNTDLMQEVRLLYEKLMQANEEEDIILRQISKVDWINLEDANNAYFHAIIIGRNKMNGIHNLMDINGNNITDSKGMEQETLKFYKELIGTSTQSLRHVDVEVLRKGKQLQENSRNSLISLITEKEVK